MTTTPTHGRAGSAASPGQLRDALLDRVEERLARLLADETRSRRTADPRSAVLVAGVAELVQAGAERAHPVICLTGYLAAGGDPAGEDVVSACAALELLDTCLMIRDDVRKNATLRRGIPTLHISHAAEHERNGWRGESRRFGEDTAVLAGDLATVYGDRLAARLPLPAWELWDGLRTERAIGAHAEAAAATEYLDDAWPGQCLDGCGDGCGAGWYGLRHALLIGAALAGRDDLREPYEEYARALHAAWRIRGFLRGGPGFDGDAQFLRDIFFDARAREKAEETIAGLLDRADEVASKAPVPPRWRTELSAFARRVAGCE
ncbi:MULTISPECIES: polyprenyl synthetase family protein [unclassified Streptomyces]|uniref:polyprenyl synthetase family protein n=1 Tax=unclassified Streptomyces TaxID=2593676 RepID=UPI002254EBBF|nr:polyprenyl synthetase family protein [Streptomyces sp. NBC_01789]MCX4447952.1 polyprenyl synthetase family protein [Streptomyces sp. NBC_01789]